jgi:hypothetical protein
MPQEWGITEIRNSQGGAKGVFILVLPWPKLKTQPKVVRGAFHFTKCPPHYYAYNGAFFFL